MGLIFAFIAPLTLNSLDFSIFIYLNDDSCMDNLRSILRAIDNDVIEYPVLVHWVRYSLPQASQASAIPVAQGWKVPTT
jgi:hypothetical protein